MTQSPGVGEEEDDATTELAEHHRHHHHGGFAMFLAMSLDTLGATPEQEATIAKIQTDFHAKMQPTRDAEKAVLLAVADGIAAGTIEQAKIEAAIAQVSTAASGIHAAIADSLAQLHATLTPQQRTALVDKMEAHFEVWHHVNTETADKDAHTSHLGELAKQLELTPDQVDKIRASFSSAITGEKPFDRAEAEAHLKAFGAAFTSDHFGNAGSRPKQSKRSVISLILIREDL